MIYYEKRRDFVRAVLSVVKERGFKVVKTQGTLFGARVIAFKVAGFESEGSIAEDVLTHLCERLTKAWDLGMEHDPAKLKEVQVVKTDTIHDVDYGPFADLMRDETIRQAARGTFRNMKGEKMDFDRGPDFKSESHKHYYGFGDSYSWDRST